MYTFIAVRIKTQLSSPQKMTVDPKIHMEIKDSQNSLKKKKVQCCMFLAYT
jgi:hypothetical protein